MNKNESSLWWVVAGSSTIGLIASLAQTIELIQHLKTPASKLICDLNVVFSCANVFGAWQSRVFGFSNSLVCMMFFAITLGIALVAATCSSVHARVRLIAHFFSVFFLAFGAWYLWQSTFDIGYICIFCLFCYSAVIIMNWAWFRLNYRMLPLRSTLKTKLTHFVSANGDTYIAAAYALIVGLVIYSHFW